MKFRLVPSRGDLFGGISAGVTALPLCLGLGVLSGLGPEAGIYGAIALGILASLFGGTSVLVSGPTTPMTLVTAGVVAASLRPNGEVNLSLVVAIFLLTGALQVVSGLLRLGSFTRYVPYPVISGFMSGIGVIIILRLRGPVSRPQNGFSVRCPPTAAETGSHMVETWFASSHPTLCNGLLTSAARQQ